MHAYRQLVMLTIPLAVGCAPAPTWLFVVDADQASLTSDSLLLTGVLPQVIAFTDRPDRLFGTTTMEDLADAWTEGSDSFEDDPPNAVVDGTYTAEDGSTSRCIVEVVLLGPPGAEDAGAWTWETVELYRWEGCPEDTGLNVMDVGLFIDDLTLRECIDAALLGTGTKEEADQCMGVD